MTRLLRKWITPALFVATLAFAGAAPLLLNTADAGPAPGIRFGIGNFSRGYPVYGGGGYGYRPSVGYGYGPSVGYRYQPYRNNNYSYYGSGPYSYGTTNGQS